MDRFVFGLISFLNKCEGYTPVIQIECIFLLNWRQLSAYDIFPDVPMKVLSCKAMDLRYIHISCLNRKIFVVGRP
jgi:hypothetical protein